MFVATSPYLKEHQNGKMGKIGLRDARPVSQNPLIGFSKTVHKLFKFQKIFFFKQNYRLTIIHSQTLQLSCNLFKLSQKFCYLYLIYISLSKTVHRLSKNKKTFSPYNSSLNSIPHQKLHTTVQKLHTLSKMYLNMFFSLFFLPKTEINTQTFYSTLSTVSLSIISHNSNIFKSLSILIKVPLQYFSIPSSLINCSSSFLFIVPATV